MPIVHARTAEAIEEERRLLYVAVTRARRHLALSWAPARAPGTGQTRQRSRFLAGLVQPADAAQPQAQPQPRSQVQGGHR
jgi:DNA helicase-2/ATP-dependent DNA helicase PcrA